MAMGTGLHALDRNNDYQATVIASTRDRLIQMEATSPPPPSEATPALEVLADQLLSMRAKGFALERLASILTQSGISVAINELDAFLQHSMLARMYACEAKVEEYGRRGHVRSTERSAFIERGLRRALETGEGLLLHYQPQVNMHTRAVVGAEALLRWRHGSDLVSPTEFIPVAEETGLIEEIGEWVLREACAEAVRWQRFGLGQGKGIKVSVNLSVKQFSDRLVDVIHGALCDAGLSTELLGVEITESFLADERSQDLLQALHDTGLHLSIDDFGTGYSCLSRVSTLPLDTIKIDRAFVVDLGRTPGAAAVVQSVIGLAEKLGMSTIAEGVETQRQVDLLRALGCTVAQGYLFAKPLPAAEFVQFASEQ
ncbi:EAL domain-containing protein (plasmid) [Cupriavidus metallidurans]|nr:EAL domain-containing protein [Cupriavidus metallidurans]